MQGFGGSPSVPTYERMSEEGKREYWALLKRYNLLIDREYPMGSELKPDLTNWTDLREATPHYYGDNFPNGEVSDFAYSKKAKELGGEVIYEMWALPAWATEAYKAGGEPILDAWNKPVKTRSQARGVRAHRGRLLPQGEGGDGSAAGDCRHTERGGTAAGGLCRDGADAAAGVGQGRVPAVRDPYGGCELYGPGDGASEGPAEESRRPGRRSTTRRRMSMTSRSFWRIQTCTTRGCGRCMRRARASHFWRRRSA